MAKFKKATVREKVYRIRWAAGSEDHSTKKVAEARLTLIRLIVGGSVDLESFVRPKVYWTEDTKV